MPIVSFSLQATAVEWPHWQAFIQPLPNKVVNIVTNEPEWSNLEQIDPEGDRLFRFSCLLENERITGLRFEFSHLVFDGECYQQYLNAFSDC